MFPINMGIYIKDMELPKNEPLLVKINPDGSVSTTARNGYRKYEAIPVPPHGRLGDLDKLEISTAVPLDGKPYRYVHLDNIKNAPTIIPKNEVV